MNAPNLNSDLVTVWLLSDEHQDIIQCSLIPQLQNEVYRNKSWLIIEPNQEIFYNYEGEEQWKASVDLASQRMMENLF